jgi:hypothetical protein
VTSRGHRLCSVGCLAAWSLWAAGTALAQSAGTEARPFSRCERVADARKLDAKLPEGVGGVTCTIAPDVRFAVLDDDAVSWPMIKQGAQPWADLKNPAAADTRAWLPKTSPPRVRPKQDTFVVLGKSKRRPDAIVYSAGTSRTDAPGNMTTYVAIRLGPQPCLLGFTRERTAALRMARNGRAPCVAPVKHY